jgi:uncharacterized protein YdeI (YjbR/CyaY-like superfamily)
VAEPVFFETGRVPRWLAEHHADHDELIVGFHKRKTGRPSMTWQQSVRVALCFGWIDGVRRSIDDERHPDPLHAAAAGQHVERDQHQARPRAHRAGEMQPAGLAAFEAGPRTTRASTPTSRPARAVARVRQAPAFDAEAAAFFDAQAPWYRRTAIHWVMSAKREEAAADRHADRGLAQRRATQAVA